MGIGVNREEITLVFVLQVVKADLNGATFVLFRALEDARSAFFQDNATNIVDILSLTVIQLVIVSNKLTSGDRFDVINLENVSFTQ